MVIKNTGLAGVEVKGLGSRWSVFGRSGLKTRFVDPFQKHIYDLNCICETEKLQSATAFSFYSSSKLTFLPKHPITRIYFSSCAIHHFVRAGVSIILSFIPPPQMTEISFWDGALHWAQELVIGTGWRLELSYQEARDRGRLKPWRPAPALAISQSGCTFPPMSSGKLARLMLRQRDVGADDVSRWSAALAVVAFARCSVAYDRCHSFTSRVNSCEHRGPDPVSGSSEHLVIHPSSVRQGDISGPCWSLHHSLLDFVGASVMNELSNSSDIVYSAKYRREDIMEKFSVTGTATKVGQRINTQWSR